MIGPHSKLDPLIWVKKNPNQNRVERRKIPFIQSSKLIQLTMERQEYAENTRSENSLSQYCCKDRAPRAAGSALPVSPAPNCEDSEGLSFRWLLLVLLTGARLGTETWKETRTEVSPRCFFGMPPVYATPHHQLPTSSSVASVQICVVALSERRRAFYLCWATSNRDWFPSIAPNVAAGASVLAQERRGGDQEEERGLQLIQSGTAQKKQSQNYVFCTV